MLNGHSKKDHKLVFKTSYRLMQVKNWFSSIAVKGILQFFRPSLSYHLLLRTMFCLFWSDQFTQILLYRPSPKRYIRGNQGAGRPGQSYARRAIKGFVVRSNTKVYMHSVNPNRKGQYDTWVKVFRIIPEFRISRLTFHRKSASKC